MNDLPVKTIGGGTVFLHDVAHVRDGNPPQQNIVHVDGSRAVLSTVLKTGQASTIDVVNDIKNLSAAAPPTAARCTQDRCALRPVPVRESRDQWRGA